MKRIPLTKGKFALVDDEDFDSLSELNWYCSYYNYAVRMTPRPHRSVLHMSRFILNCPPGKEVDHIDGDTLNNQKSNLRICNRKQNCQNKKTPKHNTSGFKGVSKDNKRKAYRVTINIDGKQLFLGYFKNKREAAKVYNYAAKKLFQKFAKVNKL